MSQEQATDWKRDVDVMPVHVFLSHASSMDMNSIPWCGHSGISIAKCWVLAHGSILAPILSRSPKFVHLLRTWRPGDLTMLGASELGIPTDDFTFRIHRDDSSGDAGKVVAFWICPLLKDTFDHSFESWTVCRLLLPVFLLIKRESVVSTGKEEESDKAEIERVLRELTKQTAIGGKLKKGAVVELISTPFGNLFFADSISRGIIGNLLGTEQCLILMDVAAFPGCEGSPLFLVNDRGDRNICGMVIASSSCYRGEWPNCTFAVNLLPSLKLILQSQIIKDEYPRYLTCTVFPFTWRNRLEIGALEKSVAIVKCGPNWGTGILVDEQSGTFVTCAHVLTTAPNTIVQFATMTSIVSCKRRSEWFAEGKLIYKTPDNQPYDIAVLRIDSKFEKPPMKAIKLADRPARKGEQVLSIGFPFSSKGRSPTITSGIVSKTSSCMLQTNCCIQNGVSGGPIVRRTDFQMLGLIVCNAASTNGSISYPKLCMAIPINVLRGPLNNYLRTNDPQTLQNLTQHDQNVVTTWNLRPFLPSSI